MKRLLLLTLMLCSFLYAEEVSLSGTVKDIKGNSLEGVTVTLRPRVMSKRSTAIRIKAVPQAAAGEQQR